MSNKTPAQLKIFEAQVRKRVHKLTSEDLTEIIQELKDSEYGGDVHLAAIEIVGSIGATLDNYITQIITKQSGGVIKQQMLKDINSDN